MFTDGPHDRNIGAGCQKNLEELNHSFLSYELLELNDLNTFLETGSFPSTDSYIKTAACPIPCSTPVSHIQPNYISPESILRSTLRRAARSFENTPSIIRKRSFKTKRQSSNDVSSSDDFVENSCISPSFQHLSHPDRDGDSNMDPSTISPAKSQKVANPVPT